MDILGGASVAGCLAAVPLSTHQVPAASLPPPPPGYDNRNCLLGVESTPFLPSTLRTIDGDDVRMSGITVSWSRILGEKWAGKHQPWTSLKGVGGVISIQPSSGSLLLWGSALGGGVLSNRLWERSRTLQLAIYWPHHHLHWCGLSDLLRVS